MQGFQRTGNQVQTFAQDPLKSSVAASCGVGGHWRLCTQVCSSSYTRTEGAAGEAAAPQLLPQYFKFLAHNPLSVRTKVQFPPSTLVAFQAQPAQRPHQDAVPALCCWL